jgi:hypothetical protein
MTSPLSQRPHKSTQPLHHTMVLIFKVVQILFKVNKCFMWGRKGLGLWPSPWLHITSIRPQPSASLGAYPNHPPNIAYSTIFRTFCQFNRLPKPPPDLAERANNMLKGGVCGIRP